MNPPLPKIIFFDIDDTLCDTETGLVCESTFVALRALRERGVRLAIATGRTPAVIPDVVWRLIEACQLDVLVCINGQFVQMQNRVLLRFGLEKSVIEAVAKVLRDKGIAHAFVDENGITTALDTSLSEAALNDLGLPRHFNPQHYLHHEVCQMLAFYPSEQDAQIQAALDTPLTKHLKIVRWHRNGVDILEKEGSKARGIQAVLQNLGLSCTQAAAFGDGNNDKEMFAAVGFSVAMGNAKDELKCLADYVAPDVQKDGIYRALCQLGWIEAA